MNKLKEMGSNSQVPNPDILRDIKIDRSTTLFKVYKRLWEVPYVVSKAANDLDPSIIVNHIVLLCRHFNTLYEKEQIIREGNELLRALKICLTYAVKKCIEVIAKILNVPLVTAM